MARILTEIRAWKLFRDDHSYWQICDDESDAMRRVANNPGTYAVELVGIHTITQNPTPFIPEKGDVYYLPNPLRLGDKGERHIYGGDQFLLEEIMHGLVFKTEEDACEVAQVMVDAAIAYCKRATGTLVNDVVGEIAEDSRLTEALRWRNSNEELPPVWDDDAPRVMVDPFENYDRHNMDESFAAIFINGVWTPLNGNHNEMDTPNTKWRQFIHGIDDSSNVIEIVNLIKAK